MKNLCGKCNVCCIEYRIDKSEVFWKDEDRADGQTCEMLTGGQCSVYNKRPNACVTFKCLWLQLSKLIENFSEEFRPDNLKLVVATSHDKETNRVDFKIRELERGRLNFDNMDTVLDRFLQTVFKVVDQQKMDGQVTIKRFGEDKAYPLKQNSGG
jgi:hypothetical protein